MPRARLITFEGIDGCGKSLQIRLLHPWLQAQGLDPQYPREPGGTAAGEAIRGILLEHPENPLSAESELLLFMAARAQICRERIAPALAAGKWVICDRFMDSSLAYQGYGRGLDLELITRLNAFAVGSCVPDLTLFLDLPLDLAEERLGERGEANRLDAESRAFKERVRQGFLAIAAKEKRMLRIDAAGDAETVQEAVRAAIRRVLL